MELKSNKNGSTRINLWVIIVPLWNWNEIKAIGIGDLSGSNCTFMELK